MDTLVSLVVFTTLGLNYFICERLNGVLFKLLSSVISFVLGFSLGQFLIFGVAPWSEFDPSWRLRAIGFVFWASILGTVLGALGAGKRSTGKTEYNPHSAKAPRISEKRKTETRRANEYEGGVSQIRPSVSTIPQITGEKPKESDSVDLGSPPSKTSAAPRDDTVTSGTGGQSHSQETQGASDPKSPDAGWKKKYQSAFLAIEYRPEVARAWEKISPLPAGFKEKFLSRLNENPKGDPEAISHAVSSEHDKEVNPFDDASMNEAYGEARKLGEEAATEFKLVVETLGNSLKSYDILKKIFDRYASYVEKAVKEQGTIGDKEYFINFDDTFYVKSRFGNYMSFDNEAAARSYLSIPIDAKKIVLARRQSLSIPLRPAKQDSD